MELRESEASSYTLRDTPTFTCVQMSLWDMLDTLGGAGSVQAVARRPARAGGFTPGATLPELPPRTGKRVYAAGGAGPPFQREGPAHPAPEPPSPPPRGAPPGAAGPAPGRPSR